MPTTGPTFDYVGRVPSPVAFTEPIPPTLREAIPDDAPAASRHRNLAQKFTEKTDELIASTAKLEQAKRDDETALAKALEAGSKVPGSKAEKVEQEIAELRHQAEILGGLLIDVSRDLLVEAAAVAPETEQRLGERSAAAIDEARAHLAAASEAFELADRLSGEGSWVGQLTTTGTVTAWSGSRVRVSQRAAGLARQAVDQIEAEARERDERLEAYRREEEALNKPRHLAGLPARDLGAPEAVSG